MESATQNITVTADKAEEIIRGFCPIAGANIYRSPANNRHMVLEQKELGIRWEIGWIEVAE